MYVCSLQETNRKGKKLREGGDHARNMYTPKVQEMSPKSSQPALRYTDLEIARLAWSRELEWREEDPVLTENSSLDTVLRTSYGRGMEEERKGRVGHK